MAVQFTKGGKAEQKKFGAVWMKTGQAAQTAIAEEDQKQKERKEAIGKLWRFWLNEGEEGRVTFVDGDLLPDGTLDIPTFREHHLKLGGKWGNFYICVGETEICPICEDGEWASLVGVLTLIDHRKIQGQKKIYQDTKKLFVATKDTIKLLQSIAIKRGGLAGATFDVLRQGANSPRCGSNFDFIEKHEIGVLQKKFVETDGDNKLLTYFSPADYEKELTYRTGAELRALGFGKGTPVGGEQAQKKLPDASKEL